VEKELRILTLEDVAAHAELIERELRKAEIIFSARCVATREAFLAALGDFNPDLILADYSLPSFDGITALSIAREQCPTVPFVFVSGALGEELAIETLKQGATDYVLKQRLERLVPAVRRALREAGERAARRQAEDALRKAHDELELRSAICRWNCKPSSCGFSRKESSSASAARRRSKFPSVSSPRRIATSRKQCRPAVSAPTCFTVSTSSR
jgi:DNA-binding response OmpR family regulator